MKNADMMDVVDVVVITALRKELTAVLRCLDAAEEVSTKPGTFYRATLKAAGDTTYRLVILSPTGMGNCRGCRCGYPSY